MIKDTFFLANTTIYNNYLRRCNNFEGRVTDIKGLPRLALLSLLKGYYKNSGSFVYEVNKYEL